MKNSILAAAPRNETQREFETQSSELRLGKDEMNLVEHPFALLRYRDAISKGNALSVFDCEWEHIHPVNGKKLKARWRVTGDPERGLPGPNEERLYIVLMEITREQKWQREVAFSRGDLLRRMGWDNSQKSRKNLLDALGRLQTVSISAERSFWDANTRDYVPTVAFHLISRFKIVDEPGGRRGQGQLPLSTFVWDEIVWNSFKAGHLRSLDTSFALSLNLPLSLRLFRYLDKHRYGKTGSRKGFEIELHKLCEVHLGMTASPYASKLKERLVGAHHELIERSFLASVVYRKMKTKEGEKVCYSFLTSHLSPVVEAETSVKAPNMAFSGLRAVLPSSSSQVDSQGVLTGFLRQDKDLWGRACDQVFESLSEVEQKQARDRVKAGLAPFLQENMNSQGAKLAMRRGIHKEVEAMHRGAVEKVAREIAG